MTAINLFETEYQNVKSNYAEYLAEMLRIIKRLVADNEIPLALEPTGRLKDLQSIQEKHFAGRYRLKNTVTELDDLVGIRLVVLFPEFVDKLKTLVEKEFVVKKAISVSSDTNRFGYSSLHLVIRIKDEWKTSPGLRGHEERRLELQIRSVAEHIWAETSHNLFYKAEQNIPNEILRDNYRLKALLEIVDGKLQEMKAAVEHYYKRIDDSSYSEILALDLNPQTLKRILLNYEPTFQYSDKQYGVLNARIEKEYEVLKAEFLDKNIAGAIRAFDPSAISIADFVIEVLEERKKLIAEVQELQRLNAALDREITDKSE